MSGVRPGPHLRRGDTAPGDTTTIQYIHAKINEPVPDATWEIPPHDQ